MRLRGEPKPVDRGLPPEPRPPRLSDRTRLRRPIRFLRQLRELQLRDLGGFALELHRVGREQPELTRSKLTAAAETDRELPQLEIIARPSDRRIPVLVAGVIVLLVAGLVIAVSVVRRAGPVGRHGGSGIWTAPRRGGPGPASRPVMTTRRAPGL